MFTLDFQHIPPLSVTNTGTPHGSSWESGPTPALDITRLEAGCMAAGSGSSPARTGPIINTQYTILQGGTIVAFPSSHPRDFKKPTHPPTFRRPTSYEYKTYAVKIASS